MKRTAERSHAPMPAKARVARCTPKFRKAAKGEAERSVANYHAILARLEKYDLPPFDAVELMRETRQKE